MNRNYETTWVVSQFLRTLEISRTEATARRWMRKHGYQDDDPRQPRWARIDPVFGPAV